MMKKIGLSLLAISAILSVGVSFADVIPDNSHYVDRCVKLQNVEIDNYRVIVENDTVTSRDVYEPQAGECLRGHYHFGESKQYLLDKSIDIEEITPENIQDLAVQIGDLRVIGGYVNNSNPLTNENFTYNLVKEYKLDLKTEDIVESEMPFKCDDCIDAEEVIESESIVDENLFEKEDAEFVAENNKIKDFCIAWVLTILIETLVLFAIAKLFRKNDQISNLRILLVGILASTVTLPLLRFVLPLFIVDEVCYIVVGELLVTLIEVFIIKYGLKISWGKAVLASVVCNLCSFLIGLIIF